MNRDISYQVLLRCQPGFKSEITSKTRMFVATMDFEVCLIFGQNNSPLVVVELLEVANDLRSPLVKPPVFSKVQLP